MIRLARNPIGRFGKPGGDRPHGRLPRLRRVPLDERRVARRRRRHHRQLLRLRPTTDESPEGTDEQRTSPSASMSAERRQGRRRRRRVGPVPLRSDCASRHPSRPRRKRSATRWSGSSSGSPRRPGSATRRRSASACRGRHRRTATTAANIDPLGRLSDRGAARQDPQAQGQHRQRRGRGGHRRDALRPGCRQARRRHLPDLNRRRFRRLRRRRARAEHRVRADGDPGRPAERRSASAARIRRGLSWKAWAQDLDEHSTDRGPHVAEPVHPRRGQQERRQVHPATPAADADRRRQPAQRRRHHRRRDRGAPVRRCVDHLR